MAIGDGVPSSSSASCSIKAEKRICRPAVPLSEATLPARVLMLYVGADCVTALDGRTATKAIAAAADIRVPALATRRCETTRFRLNQRLVFICFEPNDNELKFG